MTLLWSILIVALVCGLVAWIAQMLPPPMQPFVRIGAAVAFGIWIVWTLTHRSFGILP